MSQIIIEFKNAKELAKKIAEYHALINSAEAVVDIEEVTNNIIAKVKTDIKEYVKEVSVKIAHTTAEDTEEQTKPSTEEYVTKAAEELEQAIADVGAEKAAEVKDDPVEEVTAESAVEEVKEDIAETETPITDFDGNVVEPEELELAEPVGEVQPFDWKEFKNWLGENKGMTLKVKAVFDNHGAKSYDSSALTDAIIADLQALRAEVQ